MNEAETKPHGLMWGPGRAWWKAWERFLGCQHFNKDDPPVTQLPRRSSKVLFTQITGMRKGNLRMVLQAQCSHFGKLQMSLLKFFYFDIVQRWTHRKNHKQQRNRSPEKSQWPSALGASGAVAPQCSSSQPGWCKHSCLFCNRGWNRTFLLYALLYMWHFKKNLTLSSFQSYPRTRVTL